MATALVPRKLIDIVDVVTFPLREAVFDIRQAMLCTTQFLPLVLTELLQLSLLGLLGYHFHKFQLCLKGTRPLSHCCVF
jgi:hypothetical protein